MEEQQVFVRIINMRSDWCRTAVITVGRLGVGIETVNGKIKKQITKKFIILLLRYLSDEPIFVNN